MAIIIGVVSQKGGVGKSTIARLIARELAAQDWQVKIADLDIAQATSYHWRARRLQQAMIPEVSVEQYARVEQALRHAEHYDLLVFDGTPHASQATREIAQASDLVIIPTGGMVGIRVKTGHSVLRPPGEREGGAVRARGARPYPAHTAQSA